MFSNLCLQLTIVASDLGLPLSLYIKYCQAHVWKLEQDLEKMTNFQEMESLGERITQLRAIVENSSWKDLRSDAEYSDVVKTLFEELKQ